MREKLLIVTPSLTTTTWTTIEELLPFIVGYFDIQVVSFNSPRKSVQIKTTKIPYLPIEKLPPALAGNIFYNAIYQLPLQILSLLRFIKFRPDIIISNGFTPILVTLPFAKLTHSKIIVHYESFFGEQLNSSWRKKLLSTLANQVDLAFVNSLARRDDLSKFMNPSKVYLVNQSTDFVNYSVNSRDAIREKYGLRSNDFLILFIDNYVQEKGVETLLRLINYAKKHKHLKFWFSGEGVLNGMIQKLSKANKAVKNFEFISDRQHLKELLTCADLFWTTSDGSNLGQSGIESLAMGTPLIIPNVVNTKQNYLKKIKIDKNLIKPPLGWIVNNDNIKEIYELVVQFRKDKCVLENARKECINYAKTNFSRKNLVDIVKMIKI